MRIHLVKMMDRALSARVAPSAYLVPLQSLTFGVFFFFFTDDPSVRQSILYIVGPPFGPMAWGLGVIVGTASFMTALWFKKKFWVSLTSMFLFAVWLGAAIVYFNENYYFQFGLIFSQVLTYAYFFSANYINRLWDFTPE